MEIKEVSNTASGYARRVRQSVDNSKPNEAWFQLKKLSEYLANVFVDLAAEQKVDEDQKESTADVE